MATERRAFPDVVEAAWTEPARLGDDRRPQAHRRPYILYALFSS
jgi:hypothetical protein